MADPSPARLLSTAFDHALGAIIHFQRYPAMLPFIGEQYANPAHRKLLIVGESHFLDVHCHVHEDADRWYASGQGAMGADDAGWINTRAILAGPLSCPAHHIYREFRKAIGEALPATTVSPIAHIAFMNAFQRPATVSGGTFATCCTPTDVQMSELVLSGVIQAIRPEMIVFASVYAWKTVGRSLMLRHPDCSMDFTCHPATGGRYWNNARYASGKAKFARLLNAWAA